MFFHENYLCSPSWSRTWADVSIQISSLRLLFCYLYPKKSRYMKMKTFVNIFCRDSFRHKSWGGNINSAAYESAYIAWVSLHFAVLHKSDTDSVCIKTCKNSPCKRQRSSLTTLTFQRKVQALNYLLRLYGAEVFFRRKHLEFGIEVMGYDGIATSCFCLENSQSWWENEGFRFLRQCLYSDENDKILLLSILKHFVCQLRRLLKVFPG